MCSLLYAHLLKRASQRWSRSILEYIYTCVWYFREKILFTLTTEKRFSVREHTSLHSIMNPGEKQAEIYTYEAPWLIYACNWSVRFYDSFFFTSRSFSLSRALNVFMWCDDGIPIGGAALYSLFGMGSPNYIHTILFTLYFIRVGYHSRAAWFQLTTTTCSSFLSLSFVRRWWWWWTRDVY